MKARPATLSLSAGLMFALALLTSYAPAQPAPPAPPAGPPRPPMFASPQVAADRTVTFRLWAPNAQAVSVSGGDMPQLGRGLTLTKGPEGVWSGTTPPVDPGAYRYRFSVDGLDVVDPRNPAGSESLFNTWSLVYVPGSPTSDLKDVPHGAVATVTYYSHSLSRFRRMHVYTPPGYESGRGFYPVLYLLHGAGDSDDSWTSVGRAGFILDNLIAAKQAVPMLVVIPAGHTGPFVFGAPRRAPGAPRVDEFLKDFTQDIRPYVEAHYRARTGRAYRAVAGLSMGGMQALEIAFGNLADYGYVGVFSSGILGLAGGRNPFGAAGATWEPRHQEALDDARLKAGLRLLWVGVGKDDFLLATSRATVDLLRKHGFTVTTVDSAGGHSWINWRQYLASFAPLLFNE